MPLLFSKDVGSGSPLVFLHGFCDTHQVWDTFVAPLSASHRILTPDLPGFGQSDLLQGMFGIDDVGNAIVRWIQEKQLEKPIIVGHSLGGYVALAVAALQPDLLAGICLFHSTPYADSEERRKTRKKVMAFVRKNGVAPFVNTFVPGLFLDPGHPQMAATRQRAMTTSQDTLIGFSQAMSNRPDRIGMLLKSALPTLIIAGKADPIISAESLKKLAGMNKNCLFYELPGVAHMGIFEAEKQCQDMISRFATKVFFNKSI